MSKSPRKDSENTVDENATVNESGADVPDDEKTVSMDKTVQESTPDSDIHLPRNDDQDTFQTNGIPDDSKFIPVSRTESDEFEQHSEAIDAPEHDIAPPTHVPFTVEERGAATIQHSETAESGAGMSGAGMSGAGMSSAGVSGPAAKTHNDSASAASDIPDFIGRYQTESVLGEGAFGIVLKCIDPQLDRMVAVKLAKFRQRGSEQAVRRFLGEARAAAQLRHPNIVPVFEFGRQDKNLYIAYQFVEGETLQSLFKSGLDVDQAVNLVIQIAEALAYAHNSNIIHRDIKPANILIDEQGEAQIADFGCAKQDSDKTTQTIDGAMLGTPAYMSPEVASGKANQADARSDIWSLGVMLFELLAGERPFSGSFSKILSDIQLIEPPKLRQKNSEIPIDLETITQKCLQKNSNHRFQTGTELADELRRWQQGLPIESRRIGPIRRTAMWARRNPKWAAMWATVAVLVSAFLAGSIAFSLQLRQKQRTIVESHLESLTSAEAQSVPVIIDGLKQLGSDVSEQLDDMRSENDHSPQTVTRVDLAKLNTSSLSASDKKPLFAQIEQNLTRLPPQELMMVCQVLKADDDFVPTTLWATAASNEVPIGNRIRALCSLAQFDPGNNNWDSMARMLIGDLLRETESDLKVWLTMLQPARDRLRSPLESVLSSAIQTETRSRTSLIIATLFDDDVAYLATLVSRSGYDTMGPLMDSLSRDPSKSLSIIDQKFKDGSTQFLDQETVAKKARLAIAKARLGDATQLENSLKESKAPTLRTEIIHAGPLARMSPEWASNVIANWKGFDDKLLIAAIQMLGEYGEQQLYWTRRETMKPDLVRIYKEHPDAGVHSNCQWLLKRWQFGDELEAARKAVQSTEPRRGFRWHEDTNGICFAIFEAVESFEMGNRGVTQGDRDSPYFHNRIIPRRFGIATTEVTRKQFLHVQDKIEKYFQSEIENAKGESKALWQSRFKTFRRAATTRKIDDPSLKPMEDVTWQEAAIFCQFLNRISESTNEQTYEKFFVDNKKSMFVRYGEDVLKRTGYRLPTSGEFEYSVRANCDSKYFFGDLPTWASKYIWNVNNSASVSQPVASLKPNDFGLFDGHGNVAEWCHDTSLYFDSSTESWVDGEVSNHEKTIRELREIRDRACAFPPERFAVYQRDSLAQNLASHGLGFRLARTYAQE